jgi:hypothetical protein
MLDRPIDRSTPPQPVTSPTPDPSRPSAPETCPSDATPDPPDAWRQAFGRASQHLDGSQIRRLRSAVQQRLFDR